MLSALTSSIQRTKLLEFTFGVQRTECKSMQLARPPLRHHASCKVEFVVRRKNDDFVIWNRR